MDAQKIERKPEKRRRKQNKEQQQVDDRNKWNQEVEESVAKYSQSKKDISCKARK